MEAKKNTVPCSYFEPASIIFNQKEKVLGKKHNKFY